MNATIKALMQELAPVQLQRMQAEVRSEVARQLRERETRAAAAAVPYLAGVMYPPGAIVEHQGLVYKALDDTIGEPGRSAAWRRLDARPPEAR